MIFEVSSQLFLHVVVYVPMHPTALKVLATLQTRWPSNTLVSDSNMPEPLEDFVRATQVNTKNYFRNTYSSKFLATRPCAGAWKSFAGEGINSEQAEHSQSLPTVDNVDSLLQ